jgi:hypothetical protein
MWAEKARFLRNGFCYVESDWWGWKRYIFHVTGFVTWIMYRGGGNGTFST